ncbi:MAG: hypothetical protein LBU14_05950 [Candidatus Peribacteria bacterium]|nr:hypothetical protein [Candidatus Peribacteria bacterium]
MLITENQISSRVIILLTFISFLYSLKFNLLTSFEISLLSSPNLSFEIEKPAACLCHQKVKKKSLYFSRNSIIEKYSGHLQLAVSLSHSSFKQIQGLLKFVHNLQATIPTIQWSISFEI